jgi:hypothetical protein
VAALCLCSFLYYGYAMRLGRWWEGGSWRVTVRERHKEGTRMFVCICVDVCVYVCMSQSKCKT